MMIFHQCTEELGEATGDLSFPDGSRRFGDEVFTCTSYFNKWWKTGLNACCCAETAAEEWNVLHLSEKLPKKKWIHLLYVVFLFLFFWNAIIASCSVEAWKLCNLTDADWFCQHLWTNIPLCGTTDFRTETSQKLTLVIKCISCKGIRTYFLQ